jgi:pimeloyl-ACP methyl ester carboxylesterase
MLMVHGLMSHRGVWADTMEVFKLSHQCVALDLLGFADSPKPADGDYSIQAHARSVLKLADSLGFEHFDLLGHDMGGQIALYIAAKLAPERVTRLVSVSGVVSGKLTKRADRFSRLIIATGANMPLVYEWLYRLVRWKLFAYFVFRSWFHQMSKLPFDAWELDRQMACQRTIHQSAHRSSVSMHSTDLTQELNNIKAPTLAIFGNQDGAVPVSDGELIKQHVPDGRLLLIDQCGHYPMYEQRDRYLDALLAFFR